MQRTSVFNHEYCFCTVLSLAFSLSLVHHSSRKFVKITYMNQRRNIHWDVGKTKIDALVLYMRTYGQNYKRKTHKQIALRIEYKTHFAIANNKKTLKYKQIKCAGIFPLKSSIRMFNND